MPGGLMERWGRIIYICRWNTLFSGFSKVEKRPLGRPRRGWKDNIDMDLQRMGCWGHGLDWSGSGQGQVAGTCSCFNPLTPNDLYMSRTAPLTSKLCILYIYSTNVGTEYFKHALYSPFFSLQNAVCFIMLTCLFPVLFTFYIQGVLKFKKKIIPAPKG